MPTSRGPLRGFYLTTPLLALISSFLFQHWGPSNDPCPGWDPSFFPFFPTWSNLSSRSGILPLRGPLPIHFRRPFCTDNSQIAIGFPGDPTSLSSDFWSRRCRHSHFPEFFVTLSNGTSRPIPLSGSSIFILPRGEEISDSDSPCVCD
jgi:hypothetical protein